MWLGQGTLTFSYSSEKIPFYTKWIVDPIHQGVIRAQQHVVKQGENETLVNDFSFAAITEGSFTVELKNEAINCVRGKGTVEDQRIFWTYYTTIFSEEFEAFRGFEAYQLQENGEYLFHAEYTSTGEYITIVSGRIWGKS